MLRHGTEGCNYLLAVDVDMNTVGGYAMSSWSNGYGDGRSGSPTFARVMELREQVRARLAALVGAEPSKSR